MCQEVRQDHDHRIVQSPVNSNFGARHILRLIAGKRENGRGPSCFMLIQMNGAMASDIIPPLWNLITRDVFSRPAFQPFIVTNSSAAVG